MPIYTTQCKSCDLISTIKLTFADYDSISSGNKSLICASCHGSLLLKFNPGKVDFILSDGPSGGWISKSSRENAYRVNRRQVMTKREQDHVQPKRLVPNFQGQITSNWVEARDLAHQSTYEKVKSAQGVVTAARAAAETAKTYDHLVK